MTLLRRMFERTGLRREDERPDGTFPSLAPAMPFYAIGDIHGRADLLQRMLTEIRSEAPDATIVCVGDYIDRGGQSRDVLATLQALSGERAEKFVCIAGNHERMCLNFLENPLGRAIRWLDHGGRETLASYGIEAEGNDPCRLQRRLANAMGRRTIDWLQSLPSHWQTGNVAVVHAGADPRVPISDQAAGVLVWGHPQFETVARPDGMWVVYGHKVYDRPRIRRRRVGIDTGAYATGRLTAVRVSKGRLAFRST